MKTMKKTISKQEAKKIFDEIGNNHQNKNVDKLFSNRHIYNVDEIKTSADYLTWLVEQNYND